MLKLGMRNRLLQILGKGVQFQRRCPPLRKRTIGDHDRVYQKRGFFEKTTTVLLIGNFSVKMDFRLRDSGMDSMIPDSLIQR